MNIITISKAIVITAGLMVSTLAMAHGAGEIEPPKADQPVTLVYTNAAYTHGISGYPNPAPEVVVGPSNPIYISQAHGQAIYSYPNNVSSEERYICER